jgi:hypothetical protein
VATTSTPAWSAPRAGLLGDTGAVDHAAQINQFLGAHASSEIYQGSSILTPIGTGGTNWAYQLSTQDISQPFTMSGTMIGRVAVPLLAVGTGADLTVSLYTNNSGVPGTLVNSTRIPANWITQLSAVTGVAGPSSVLPTTQYTNNPLALGQFNTLQTGPLTTVNWPYPSASSSGPVTAAISGTFGNYFFQIGGNPGGLGTLTSAVYTIGFDAAGNVSPAVPQPAFPTAIDTTGSAVVVVDSSGNYTLVQTGGEPGGSPVNTAYTASVNPLAGTIASWSSQAALPTNLFVHSMASYNGYVYVIGGETAASIFTANVYYAQVQNGQITAWTQTNSLPQAIADTFAVAIDGFVYVVGGFNGVSQRTTTYYAAINANGSLGPWQTGPALPAANGGSVGTAALAAANNAILINGSNSLLLTLGVTANGPDISWQSTASGNYGSNAFGMALAQPGQWAYYGLYPSAPTAYVTVPIALTPRISVPLPTTGLTNSTTYHIVLSQPNGDLNDYLRTHDDFDVFPGNPTLLTRTKGSSTWTAGTSGHAVPIQVYDLSAGYPGTSSGQPWHTWADSGARISTIAWATTPDRRPLGILDAVAQPGPVLNMNPTFTVGTAPWSPFNGTIAQSNTFTHGALPFSLQVTPTGGNPAAGAFCEFVPATPGHTYVGSAWAYSAVGYAHAQLNVNWWDSTHTFITNVSGADTNLAAGTWTQFTSSGIAPSTAAYVTIILQETSTPANTAVFYMSAATIQDTSGPMLSTVTQVTYNGTWPSPADWPPTGTKQLA